MALFPFSTKEKPKIALKREMLSDDSICCKLVQPLWMGKHGCLTG